MAASGALQPQLLVGAANDPFEREADRTADAVIGSTAFETPAEKDKQPQRLLRSSTGLSPGPSVAPSRLEASISADSSRGRPLDASTRAYFEPRFGHDFGDVRTHTDDSAASSVLSLGARAFTVGNHIFFGAGEFQPASSSGRRLLAHELTHTIQQKPTAARTVRRSWLGDIKDAALGKLREWADELPPYDLLTVLIGLDPLTGKKVDRTPRTIVRAALKLHPDGVAIFEGLEKNKTIDDVSRWFEAEIAALDLTWEGIKALFSQAWDELGTFERLNPRRVWEKIKAVFGPTVRRLARFAANVALKILELLKKIVLDKISAWARQQTGYPLLVFVLGKDPVTGEAVPRTASAFVKAVLALVKGGDKIYENLQKTKALERTVTWLHTEITKLDLSWEKIKDLFRQAWDAFSVTELLQPLQLLERMASIFGPPVKRVISFALAAGKKVLEFVFEGAMAIAGPIGMQIVRIVRRAGDTFDRIVADPIRFAGNLVGAVKLGFSQFGKNIWEHLKTGLIGWLVASLEGAGVVLPKVWNLQGIVSLSLQILGITYAKMRVKLVKVIGEERMAMLEQVFGLVRTLVTEGPSALWQQIVDAVGSFWDLVIGGIRDWAVTKIVTAAITKLATMLNPAGAIIQAIIAIYQTIAFFVERIKQILALVEAVIDSIAAIAAGKLSQAADFVEQTMARTIPMILGFLARLIGLGDVSEQIKKVITNLQDKVDKGIDKAIAWVVEKAKSLLGKNADKPHDERWAAGVAGVNAEIDKMGGIDPEAIEKALPSWQKTYGFTSLELVREGNDLDIIGGMSTKHKVRALPEGIEYKKEKVLDNGEYKASRVFAAPLRRTDDSAPYNDPVGWKRLDHQNWVRGHLLHGRSGGPGAYWNLTPIPKTTNSAMYQEHEKELYNVVLKKKNPRLTWFEARVQYHRNDSTKEFKNPQNFPSRIDMAYGSAVKKGGKFTIGTTDYTNTYDIKLPTMDSKNLSKP